MPAVEIPVFKCSLTDLPTKLKPEPGSAVAFRSQEIGSPRDVLLLPFYKVFEPRYSVYWKVQPPEK
jgi:hypothetical protein